MDCFEGQTCFFITDFLLPKNGKKLQLPTKNILNKI